MHLKLAWQRAMIESFKYLLQSEQLQIEDFQRLDNWLGCLRLEVGYQSCSYRMLRTARVCVGYYYEVFINDDIYPFPDLNHTPSRSVTSRGGVATRHGKKQLAHPSAL